MKKIKVIVVGGGASGMIAAITAKRLGAAVTILEQNPRIGKKILVTGNGRCNYTNINLDMKCFHGQNPEFIHGALEAMTVDDTLKFFEKLGITPKIEEEGKVFPSSEQASSILDVLLYELTRLDVEINCEAKVKSITKEKDKFRVELASGKAFYADKVILAAGGKALPSSGSDGNGYHLAQSLGHRITEVFPALVQLKLDSPFLKRLEGVKFSGTAEIISQNMSMAKDRGDILFTNYGISGPPILQLSRKAGELLHQGQEVLLKIAMMDLTKEELTELIERRFRLGSHKTIEFSLVGLINKRLIPVILIEAGIKNSKESVAQISLEEQTKIVDILLDWRFIVRGTKSWPSAQTTAGGVDTSQINPSTLESKLAKGLYLAGEIIDVDGICGGFNLQWAWSSGFLAGQSAALGGFR